MPDGTCVIVKAMCEDVNTTHLGIARSSSLVSNAAVLVYGYFPLGLSWRGRQWAKLLNYIGQSLTTEVSDSGVHGVSGLMDKITDYSLASGRAIKHYIYERSTTAQMKRNFGRLALIIRPSIQRTRERHYVSHIAS